jgi:uncharacterized protein YegL
MIILVIDVSGSMESKNRIELAANAAKAVVKTLAWKDQVGFVLFDGKIAAKRAPEYVTDDNRNAIDAWIDQNVVTKGGTAFKKPILQAIKYIDADPQCSNVILMLTDGSADFSDDNYATVKKKLKTNNIVLFTYALGSGADSTVMKRLACENDGIFYKVKDGASLGEAMSSYYAYYAASISNTGVRWILYTDAITGTELLAACTPLYDTTDPTVEISVTFGVVCMDLNVIRSVEDLRTDPGWDSLYARTETGAETCIASWSGRSRNEIDNALKYVRNLESSNGAKSCGNNGIATWLIVVLSISGVLFLCLVGYVIWKKKIIAQTHAATERTQSDRGEIAMGVVQPVNILEGVVVHRKPEDIAAAATALEGKKPSPGSGI